MKTPDARHEAPARLVPDRSEPRLDRIAALHLAWEVLDAEPDALVLAQARQTLHEALRLTV